MTIIASIRHDHLESILFYGFLNLRDFCTMEIASSKWRYYVLGKHKVSKNFCHKMDMSIFQCVYDFSSFKHRKQTLQKEQWFNRRNIFKMSSEVILTGFDDNSCRIGIDILANRKNIVKFTINNSYRHVPCDDSNRSKFGNYDDDEKDLASFINRLESLQLKELCFNFVPNLWCGEFLANLSKMSNLRTLKVLNCANTNVFYFLEHCCMLEIFHYIEDNHSRQYDVETIIDHFNGCKLLNDVFLCAETADEWGIITISTTTGKKVISKLFPGRIKFNLFDSMAAYYAMNTEFNLYNSKGELQLLSSG